MAPRLKLLASTVATIERRRPRVLDELHPELRGKIEKLLVDLGGIVTPWEGYRDQHGQERALASGVSRAGWLQSPHNYRPALACDLVLHPALVVVRAHPENPGMPDLWDTSSPSAVKAWAALEDYCALAGLDRVTIGGGRRDWPHVQLPRWRSYLAPPQ